MKCTSPSPSPPDGGGGVGCLMPPNHHRHARPAQLWRRPAAAASPTQGEHRCVHAPLMMMMTGED